MLVYNKIDLHTAPHTLDTLGFLHVAHVSAKTQAGLEALHKKIDEVIFEKGPPHKDEVVITSLRHKESLTAACSAVEKVICGLESNVSAEFAAFDMRQALNELGTIIGTNITEDMLTTIFSKFCIGK